MTAVFLSVYHNSPNNPERQFVVNKVMLHINPSLKANEREEAIYQEALNLRKHMAQPEQNKLGFNVLPEYFGVILDFSPETEGHTTDPRCLIIPSDFDYWTKRFDQWKKWLADDVYSKSELLMVIIDLEKKVQSYRREFSRQQEQKQ